MTPKSVSHLVTILVPTLNREILLQKTLDTFRYIPGVKVIVINDGGRPVQIYAQNIEVINLPTTVGEAEVVNIGWNLANTKYFAVVSDDDPQPEKWLPPLLECAERNPNYIAYYPNTEIIKLNGQIETIKAKTYNKKVFLDLLKCPCLAGVLINREILCRHGIQNLRIPGMLFPNDLIQWLELTNYGVFFPVEQSTSSWWVHRQQLSETLGRQNQALMYYSNVTNWQIKHFQKKMTTSKISITLLRSMQIAMLDKSDIIKSVYTLLNLHFKSFRKIQAVKAIVFFPVVVFKLIIFKAIND
jgi:glycosyltransferase involved in cell wall biosynthesis